MMLVWRAAMSTASGVGKRGPKLRSTPRSEERKECASGRLAHAQCAQVGETEHVSQQEHSTSGTTVCLTSMIDAVCVNENGNNSGVGVDRPA